jgi:tRNA threonylcarbamoyl adenosine modification protein (Sua5/YciO/YrdC/YwlC family)
LPEVLTIDRHQPDPAIIAYCVYRLKRGDVIGMPTDTFYGLAVDPVNLRAVKRVYEIKSRPSSKPLSLLIGSIEQAITMTNPRELPPMFFKLAERFWPGPLTMIVNAGSSLPLRVTANTGNVAVRVPAAPISRAVVKAMNFPITATAASLMGSPECVTASEVCDQLGERISLVLDAGEAPRREFSTIVDLSGTPDQWKIQRAGAIPAGEVAEILWA